MKKYCLITDSGADLSKELIEKYKIRVNPFFVILPDTEESLKEGVDITNKEYYERVLTANNHPSTAHANPHDILELYKALESEGFEEIFYVTMASSVTGTNNTAHLAKRHYLRQGGKANITIYDSAQASMAIGIQAIKAAKLFEEGLSAEEVVEKLNHFRMNELKSTLTVETLKYLMKSGRVSKFRYAVGTALKLTPCLEGTYSGKLEAFGAARSYEAAIKKIIDRAYSDIKTKANLAVYLTSGKAEEGLKIAKEYLKEKYNQIKILGDLDIGASIFTHTGPGIVAIIMFHYFDH